MKLKRIITFFITDVWQIQLNNLSFVKAYGLRCLRVIMLAVRTFIQHDCSKTATTLTYYSLLNIVPLFAVVFAIAKGFGLQKLVIKQILSMAQAGNWQADITNQIINFSKTLLSQAKGGLIAGVGIILLLWTVISILGKIEDSFNTIWEVKRPRTLVRKCTDYLSIMVLAPILFALSSSITIMAASQIQVIVHSIKLLGPLSPLIFLILDLLPYFTMWCLLAAIYLVMPNAKISVRSGILAAVVAGTVFQLVQWVYIKFQIGVTSQSAIYGSFAALPLFLGWLQISWMIVLFGAEIAHASEHHETFGFHPDYSRIGSASKKLLVLRIFHILVKKFAAGEKPLTVKEIAHLLGIPVSLVRGILYDLMEAGIVVEITKGIRKEASFQPGRDIEDITIKKVLDAYEKGEEPGPVPMQGGEAEKISHYMKLISEAEETSPGNVKLKEI
ncbi:MAG: YihY/virulence factor BrkB family protein [Syntrophus sp. (in: bacteria)]|nr:YihY/virulence factor BrkB family protein [Syntrophus sp. (in: bacteria)]